jgi:hypothetical protein
MAQQPMPMYANVMLRRTPMYYPTIVQKASFLGFQLASSWMEHKPLLAGNGPTTDGTADEMAQQSMVQPMTSH